jgi:Rrf2 family protein
VAMISKKMKYAIKALTYLARHSAKERCVRTAEIAEAEMIPKKFLEQILLEMKKARLVNSIQGNMGGYYLLKSAQAINLAEVYRLFEGPIALIPCASDTSYEACEDCRDENKCKIKRSIRRIRNQTLMAMDQVTFHSLS